MLKKTLAAALIILAPGTAMAASGNTATATGTVNATVIAPLQIAHTAGAALNFGSFTAGTGGTIAVSQAGVVTAGGDVGTVTGATAAADAFTVTGSSSRTFTISTSSGITVSNGAATMALALSAPATGTLSGAGSYTLRVGGTLTVASAQAPGAYTGTYTVTVTYQ